MNAASNLAIDLAYEGKFAAAEEQFRSVLQMHRDSLGADDPKTIAAETNVGAILLQEDKYPRLRRYYAAFWFGAARVGTRPSDDPVDHGKSRLGFVAGAAANRSRATVSRDLGHQTKETGPGASLDPGHSGNLADVLREEGKFAEAETLTRETLAIERRTLGNDHSDTQATVQAVGQLLTAQGHYAEAERLLREAYDTRLRILGRDHSQTAEAAYNLGALYAAQGKKEEAMVPLVSAVDHGLSANLIWS